jgi:hypothetical protein
MSEPAPVGIRQLTSVNGVEVIATEPAFNRHPRWGWERPVPLAGVTKILLADNTIVHSCNDCDYIREKPESLQAHRNGTHDRTAPHHPITPPQTIKAVIRAVETARRAGVRAYSQAAAEALNAAGVTSATGGEWSSASVSSLYVAYRDDPTYNRVRISKSPNGRPVPAPTPRRPADGSVELTLAEVAAQLVLLARRVNELAQQEPPQVDPEILEKAQKYDQLRGLIG